MNRRLSILFALLAAGAPFAAIAQDDAPAAAVATNAPSATDRNVLELVVRRNIFDSTRVGARAPRQPRAEYFTFCGGAFDGPTAVAFFSGAGASNRPLKPGDWINGFKVGDITFHSVKLQLSTGAAITLNMSGSMRREPKGPWKPSEDSAAPPETTETAGTDTPGAAAPGKAVISARDSDVIKRLKARHNDD